MAAATAAPGGGAELGRCCYATPGRGKMVAAAAAPGGGGAVPAALLAKERQCQLRNAELEAKTAALVQQAEAALRDQREALSRPIPAQPEQVEEEAPPGPPSAAPRPHAVRSATDVAGPDVARAKIEGRREEGVWTDREEDVLGGGSGIGAEAQIRLLKAKLRVMQEELDNVGRECREKDDESRDLRCQLKEAEEERRRLQRAAGGQRSQLEKYKLLAEEAARTGDGLRQQVLAQEKELENFNRAQRQASSSQTTTEVRLHRALEDAERAKREAQELKQSNKELVSQGHAKLDELRAENKRLEKQKGELMAAFKKQSRLIDILRRQKMHIEAAQMLSFTEEEFAKALEWGNP